MTPPRLPRALLSAVVLALVCAGCGSPATPSAAKQGAEQAAEQAEPPPSPEPEATVPVIASDEATFDFGTIAPNEKVTHVFKLVNRGRADLHIERVERT